MQIEIIKSKSRVLMTIVVVAMCMFIGVAKVGAVEREDPAVGTASPEIENMIAQGKSIVGKTPYVLGGGHGNTWVAQREKAVPDSLDCSSFVSWTLYRGMGVSMGGRSQTTRSIIPYTEEIGRGSFDGAQRGDLFWTPGHIELYLGKNSDGEHITMHAQNPRKNIGITLANWGNGASSARILRITQEDAKAEKRGLDYDPSRIVDSGVEGVTSGEGTSTGSSSSNKKWGDFSEEDLYRWKDPIVKFKKGNTHSESAEEEKVSESNSKGLKGNKGGIFSGLFGK